MNTLSQGIANLKNLYNQEFNTYATAQQDIKSNATSRAQYNIDVNDAMAKSIGNTITGALPGITGQVAKSAFDIVSPAIAFGASPGHDIVQAKERVDAQFKGASPTIMAEGPTIGDYWSGIKAENIPSTAFYRALGFAQPLAKDLTSSGQSIIDFFNPRKRNQLMNRRNQLMNRRKQDMQQKIRQAEAVQQVQQNIQTYGTGDRPNEGMNTPGGGKGQSPTGGDVAGTPFVRGGRASYFDGGLLSLWPR